MGSKLNKSKFLVTYKDESILELVRKVDHKTLAIWAIDCVERVLPYFEDQFPDDTRPRSAIDRLRDWVNDNSASIPEMRKIAFEAHNAARDVGDDNPARSVARAAGQAAATAHVPTHSIMAANYAVQAIYRATSDADAAIAAERDWQYERLFELWEEFDRSI